jgi:hypothetical protein
MAGIIAHPRHACEVSLETSAAILLLAVIIMTLQLVIVVLELGRMRRDLDRLLARPWCPHAPCSSSDDTLT